ncbi:HlyD family efflux transporter periplasmic adaptor subunit [Pacificimonas sp. WHA3]|uniref:HlyD family efflux transporter periplasmic adaptor subunit n=1 Tax=Pacificimonas pallii TaxID=2827236 RepID=A0ABS6SG67_9SPHN|nr:HlyD family efflux transporter periplasmic adaptor subunit [Pacificimonas pallii]MBV7257412.1 HlyD family efflux transporter periplasmic adaptor subunit [Pacificimonas pallii]
MDRRIEAPKPKSRTWAVRLGIGLVAILAILFGYRLIPASGSLTVDAAMIRTGEVVRAPFQDYVPLRAKVAPFSTTFVASVAGGQVEALIASDGQLVTKGDALVRLTNPALELDVASRSADIAGQLGNVSGQRLAVQRGRFEGDKDLAEARNALMKAEEDYQAKAFLFERQIVNQAALDPVAAEVAFRRARLHALEQSRASEQGVLASQSARIGRTEAQLNRSLAMVRRSLDALTIRGPVSGRLTAFTLQAGQTLTPGDPVGQIDSEGRWKLIADVDQFYLGRVETGLAARATIGGKVLPMTVIKVLPQVTDGQFRIELGFTEEPSAQLNRGQTIDVRLVLGADRPALVAPSGGWLDGNGTSAFVMDGEGRAHRRAITSGRRNPDQVEITSGLSAGDRIVTSATGSYADYDTLILN